MARGGGGEGGAGSLKAKHYIFVVSGGDVFFLFFFSFFPAMMNKQNIGSRKKLSPWEYTVLYPSKIRLQPGCFTRLF